VDAWLGKEVRARHSSDDCRTDAPRHEGAERSIHSHRVAFTAAGLLRRRGTGPVHLCFHGSGRLSRSAQF
jgi:hypothetical protein